MDIVIDSINMRTMRSSAAASTYTHSEGLTPVEQAAFGRVAAAARGKPILDIGFGGGRTVDPLLAISTDYLGIDYCQEMVDACRRKHPGVRLQLADARDLSQLQPDSIALAVFRCNGIGMVNHADRLVILAQVHRVLRLGWHLCVLDPQSGLPTTWPAFAFRASSTPETPRASLSAARASALKP